MVNHETLNRVLATLEFSKSPTNLNPTMIEFVSCDGNRFFVDRALASHSQAFGPILATIKNTDYNKIVFKEATAAVLRTEYCVQQSYTCL